MPPTSPRLACCAGWVAATRGTRAAWLAAVCGVFLFVVGLWPFSFSPSNQVRWSPGRAVAFAPPAIAFTPLMPAFCAPNEPFSFELEVDVVQAPADGAGREFIIVLGETGRQCNLALIRERGRVVGLVRTVGSPTKAPLQRVVFPEELPCGNRTILRLCGDACCLRAYVGSTLVASTALDGGLAAWDRPLRIFLGNDDSGECSWTGSLWRCSLRFATGPEAPPTTNDQAGGSLGTSTLRWEACDPHLAFTVSSQSLPESLLTFEVPRPFEPEGKTAFGTPPLGYLLTRSGAADLAINLLGFVPFGFLVGMALPRPQRGAGWLFPATLVVGTAISVAIEGLQTLLPLRTSSTVDLAANALGALVGAVVAGRIVAFSGPPRGGCCLAGP